ncbi:hypothetical protein PRK78_006701 [Emydomyces testavorans]|uniref:Uncharacterized protein n=1 Tax=Emydomyces testavorans TaxID=2070801 RepID=A0AAF0ILY7_9EURO|nr:hypothetical protein PRK78_006701 [Emydomyces testavorans]
MSMESDEPFEDGTNADSLVRRLTNLERKYKKLERMNAERKQKAKNRAEIQRRQDKPVEDKTKASNSFNSAENQQGPNESVDEEIEATRDSLSSAKRATRPGKKRSIASDDGPIVSPGPKINGKAATSKTADYLRPFWSDNEDSTRISVIQRRAKKLAELSKRGEKFVPVDPDDPRYKAIFDRVYDLKSEGGSTSSSLSSIHTSGVRISDYIPPPVHRTPGGRAVPNYRVDFVYPTPIDIGRESPTIVHLTTKDPLSPTRVDTPKARKKET